MKTSPKLPALLVVAHGSRRHASNEEIKTLTEALSACLHRHFSFISCAFLELAKPSIPEGIERCVAVGADKVLILPYFLSAGMHIARDIPAEIGKKKEQHPGVRIEISDYCGQSEKMVELLSALATRHRWTRHEAGR